MEDIFGKLGEMFNPHTEEKECEFCEDGEVFIETHRDCTKYRGDCCGGCGYTAKCPECNND